MCVMKAFAQWMVVIIAVIGFCGNAVGQDRALGVAYYDIDGLYDTIPSKFYDDRDFTPEGRLRWNSVRYERKIRHTVAVIDSMALPVVALRGVENEQVVRDIVAECENLYSYLHRSVERNRGKDFALLYYGDIFTPKRVWQQGQALCVVGEVISGKSLAFIVHYRSRDLKHIIDQVRQMDATCRVIVLGGSYGVDFSKLGIVDECRDLERRAMGTRLWRGSWQLSDRIASDMGCKTEAGVYIKRWLLDGAGRPLPTYESAKYYGGYSSNLPIYVYFDEFFVN